MATAQENFTRDEWFLLTTLPSMIGATVTAVDDNGMFGTMKEVVANIRAVTITEREFPNNLLIQELLGQADDGDDAQAIAAEYRNMAKARMDENRLDSIERFQEQMLEDCRGVSKLLEEKSSRKEADEYKAWAMSAAEAVAGATKRFFGFGGKQISEAEQTLLDKIRLALGVPRNTEA